MMAFGYILAKNYLVKAALKLNWESGSDTQYCCMQLLISSVHLSMVLSLKHPKFIHAVDSDAPIGD
jgi:hypothetical protein